MGDPNYKIVTFNTAKILIGNGEYASRKPLPTSDKGMTKAEVLEYMYIQDKTGTDFNSYPSNRLIAKKDLLAYQTMWVGDEDNAECVDNSSSTTPPSAPTISLVSKTENSIVISWTTPSSTNTLSGYVVYYSYQDPPGSLPIIYKSVTVGLINQYTLTNLPSDTQVTIYVRAFDDVPLYSDDSNYLTITTDAPPAPEANRPGTLSFSLTTTSYVKLNWEDPKEFKSGQSVDYFKVEYKKATDSTWTVVSTNIVATARTYTVQGLTANTNYEFRMKFIASPSGEHSEYSNTVMATTTNNLSGSCGNSYSPASSSSASATYEITMSGTGTSTTVYMNPDNIPDRFRIFSGGILLFDSGYIGMDYNSNISDYYSRILVEDYNVDPATLNLENNNGTSKPYSVTYTLQKSQVVDDLITIIVDAPLRQTGWDFKANCF